jgi:hypothetical protein
MVPMAMRAYYPGGDPCSHPSLRSTLAGPLSVVGLDDRGRGVV